VADLRNVVLVTVDSLMPDWIDPDKSARNAFPTLHRIWREGITCQNGFSHGVFSQISFPSIFTSTLPLDCGGYDHGIGPRPVSIAQVCHEQGLQTAAFSSDPYASSFYGYNRGFDSFEELYDISLFLRNIDLFYLRPYADLRGKGGRADASIDQRVASLLEEAFKYVQGFCVRRQAKVGRFRLCSESIVDHFDFRRLAHLIGIELGHLRDDPQAHVDRVFGELDSHGVSEIAKAADISILRPVLRSMWAALKRTAPGLARTPVSARAGFDLKALAPSYVSADHMLRKARAWLVRNSTDPFFLWIALNDPHELSFSKLMSPYAIRQALQAMRRTLRGPEILYALSVKYVDATLAKLIRFLRSRDCLDNTLLVICSDHGRVLDAPELQADSAMYKGPFRDLREDLIRVPMMFWNPHIESTRLAHPCGLIDLAPTIVDLMGWPSVPEFQGVPVYSDAAASRSTLIIDGMNGPCDLKRLTPSICVLRDERLYICHGDVPVRVLGLGQTEDPTASHEQDASGRSARAEAEEIAVSRLRSLVAGAEESTT